MGRNREGFVLEKGITEVPAARARWTLAGKVSRALTEAGLWTAAERAVRVSVPVGRESPFSWLRAQGGPRAYWSGRDGGLEVAAAGVADLREGNVPESATALRKRFSPLLSSNDSMSRYYGGLRFDPYQQTGAEWTAFGGYRFVLPRYEFVMNGSGGTELACNLVLPRDAERGEEILEEIENLPLASEPAEEILPAPLSRTDAPAVDGWRRNVERALDAFEEGRLGKVVLARRVELGLEGAPEPLLLAERLKSTTPGCFHFYFEPVEGTVFLGASPERLYRREGREIRSEAVAGTRPRGESAKDDAAWREELLRSAKDQAEHAYVRLGIRESLAPLCEELEIEDRVADMKLARGRHLVSGVNGTLREGVTDANILEALHPTPAVSGYPGIEALREIRKLEPFDRGWYAGAVGWIGGGGAEFAVGIRSGLVRGRTLSLYSGAGIVAGSEPDEERAEIEQKIGDFTRILGLGPEDAAS